MEPGGGLTDEDHQAFDAAGIEIGNLARICDRL
jgi:hypothetical protein